MKKIQYIALKYLECYLKTSPWESQVAWKVREYIHPQNLRIKSSDKQI